MAECTRSNFRNVVTDNHFSQLYALKESMVTDSGHTVFYNYLFYLLSVAIPRLVRFIVLCIICVIIHRASAGDNQSTIAVQHPIQIASAGAGNRQSGIIRNGFTEYFFGFRFSS